MATGRILVFIHLNSSHYVIAQLPLDTFIDPRKEAKRVKDVGFRSSEKIITFIEKEQSKLEIASPGKLSVKILGTAAVRPLLQLDVQELHLLYISSKVKHKLYGI